MTLDSWTFAAFVDVVLVVYVLLGQRGQKHWLLLASYVFYATWAWQLAAILALITVVDFWFARRLFPGGDHRTGWLWLAIGSNVSALGLLRYAGTPMTGAQAIGASFYTLQAISFLVAVHAGTLRAPLVLADVALYLAYFPKLLAGPIERPGSLIPRFAQARVVDKGALARGACLIVLGAVRKLVLADSIAAMIPEQAFVSPMQYGSATLAAALIGYVFFLYNDFAGYTDLARGVSELFGIPLSANFHQPFFSRSFADLWGRWHATLTRWLRDHVYFPLSRAILRRRSARMNVCNLIVPPLAAMLVSGLWHGAKPGMIVWGIAFASFLIIERLPSLRRRPVEPGRTPASRQVLATLTVFVLGVLALAPFRMGLTTALAFWRTLFTGAVGGVPPLWLLAPIGVSLGLDWVQFASGDDLVFLRWPWPARVALLAAALLACFLATSVAQQPPFVYQAF